MGYTLCNKCAKNLCKRTVLLQLIIKNVVTSHVYFLRHSVISIISLIGLSKVYETKWFAGRFVLNTRINRRQRICKYYSELSFLLCSFRFIQKLHFDGESFQLTLHRLINTKFVLTECNGLNLTWLWRCATAIKHAYIDSPAQSSSIQTIRSRRAPIAGCCHLAKPQYHCQSILTVSQRQL